MRKTVVIFDLWETLFTDERYDFEAGLNVAHEKNADGIACHEIDDIAKVTNFV